MTCCGCVTEKFCGVQHPEKAQLSQEAYDELAAKQAEKAKQAGEEMPGACHMAGILLPFQGQSAAPAALSCT